jgi:hypothetical protein
MNKPEEVLLRLMRSLDVEHLAYDFPEAASEARGLLESLNMPIIPTNDAALVSRAEAVELFPYWGAGKYGDQHPIGTFTIDLDLDVALFLEKKFSMVTENAPDGYGVLSIYGDEKGDGMSVSDDNESQNGFITLICRDRSDSSDQFTLMVGPDRLRDVVEALEEYQKQVQ